MANACVVQPFPRRVRQESPNTIIQTLERAIISKLQSAGAVCTNALLAIAVVFTAIFYAY
jgi:hypothetical protein